MKINELVTITHPIDGLLTGTVEAFWGSIVMVKVGKRYITVSKDRIVKDSEDATEKA